MFTTFRLNDYDPDHPELRNLVDAITGAADRASGILNSLYWAHEGTNASEMSAKEIRDAADAAIFEVRDISTMLNHYHESTRQNRELDE